MSNTRSEHPVKKFFMRHVWRVQQIGAISTLIITATTLAITVSDKLLLNKALPFGLGPLVALAVLGSTVVTLGWLWDKKLQMWKEQNVVNVERNPYYMHKMTPKESLSYTHIWVPFLHAAAEKMECPQLHDTANAWDKWCKEQNAKDPILNASVKELTDRYFKEE